LIDELNGAESRKDHWFDWLLFHRHLNDPECLRLLEISMKRVRDRILDGACLCDEMLLVDVGAGDGNVAFAAIERVGPSLQVIMTDISVPLLRHVESQAVKRGVRGQCRFLQCAAEDLHQIPDASVDIVTMRAVLAYVNDKPAALRECYRVLKPGGRLSFAEPVFQDDAIETMKLKIFLEQQPRDADHLFLSLLQRWKAAQFPDTPELMERNCVTNYSDRDLFRYVCGAGFVDAQLNLHLETVPHAISSWEVFLHSLPYPWAPSLDTILRTRFTLDERRYFEQTVRPIIEMKQATSTNRNAYVTARRPSTQTIDC
jgi:SAM-dependent methyltransferase